MYINILTSMCIYMYMLIATLPYFITWYTKGFTIIFRLSK